MSRSTLCIGSYYQHEEYRALLDMLAEDLEHDDYSILVCEQRGASKTPSGFSAIYNRLVNCAFADPDCQFAWLLNDDACPAPDCLEETEALLAADPTIGVAFPIEAWVEDGNWVTMMPVTGKLVTIWDALEAGEETFEQVYAGFACACITREAWEAVGQMDESLGKGYAEDLDWGIRCWKAGFRVVNYRRQWFKHKRGATFNKLTEEGKFRKEEPYEAADLAKKKWPWLWTGEPFEQTMSRLHDFYKEGRRSLRFFPIEGER